MIIELKKMSLQITSFIYTLSLTQSLFLLQIFSLDMCHDLNGESFKKNNKKDRIGIKIYLLPYQLVYILELT